MSTDEYVPSDEDAADNYVSGRGSDDPGLSLAELRAEYGPEFDRFLARVRREALDGLIDHARHLAQEGTLGPGTAKVQSGAAVIAEEYRDTRYPEENPVTVQPTRDQLEAELDSWMTRAYEAEKRAWQAEKRIVEEKRLRMKATAAATEAEARIKAVRELHSESRIIPDTPVFGCAECGEPNETEPCATIRALEG